jgi:HSP20 family protein
MTLPVRRRTEREVSRWSPFRAEPFTWDPFGEFDRLSRQMAEFVDRWMQSPVWSEAAFVPAADLEETDDAYLVEVELPGVKKEDIDVELEGRRLAVTGERKEKERSGIVRRRTRTVGRFRYEVVFPGEVDDNGVEASFADGVLNIRVPKAESERAKRIQVR